MAQCAITVLNGPNLNMLGSREPDVYGDESLSDIESMLQEAADSANVVLNFHQSNSEAQLVDWIQATSTAVIPTGLIINPGAYSHTSIAIRDALAAVNALYVEVHLSNIHARETFRHQSFISPLAYGVLCGFGSVGYKMAFDSLVNRLTMPK